MMIRRARTKTQSIPAPTRGWNTRDNIAEMDPRHAIIMDNWFPDDEDVRLRRGHEEHASGIGSGAVETLMTYNAPSGTSTLFAAGNSAIYDASSSGAVGAAAVSSLTNNRWEYINFGTSGGNFLLCVNGADGLRSFNGSAWATESITGVTAANLSWIGDHQRRVFFGESGSLTFGYLAAGAKSGAASTFDLGPLCDLGGYLMGMVSWSIDSGEGLDDLAVFVTSEGEAIVYAGTDPSSASTWVLKGRHRIGAPIGRRFFAKFGGDSVIITEHGFVPLSTLVSGDRSRAERKAISSQIAPTVNTSARNYGGNFGWQPIVYPRGRMLLFNVPVSENSTAHQYVFNTTTFAPCRFTGMNANCWGIFNDELYFGGGGGKVYKADTGADDDGVNISGDLKPAFSYFGARGRQKLFKMARPTFQATNSFSAALNMNVDFEDAVPTASPTFSGSGVTTWNNFNWNAALWGGAFTVRDWVSITGIGYSGAMRIITSTQDTEISLRSIDYLYEEGGVL